MEPDVDGCGNHRPCARVEDNVPGLQPGGGEGCAVRAPVSRRPGWSNSGDDRRCQAWTKGAPHPNGRRLPPSVLGTTKQNVAPAHLHGGPRADGRSLGLGLGLGLGHHHADRRFDPAHAGGWEKPHKHLLTLARTLPPHCRSLGNGQLRRSRASASNAWTNRFMSSSVWANDTSHCSSRPAGVMMPAFMVDSQWSSAISKSIAL